MEYRSNKIENWTSSIRGKQNINRLLEVCIRIKFASVVINNSE
jgi:hypothetical protein